MAVCQRCVREETLISAEIVRLFGGAIAALCPPCRTAWHGYLMAQPLAAEITASEAEGRWLEARVAAQQMPTKEEIVEAYQHRVVLESQAFALSVAWLQTTLAPREEA